VTMREIEAMFVEGSPDSSLQRRPLYPMSTKFQCRNAIANAALCVSLAGTPAVVAGGNSGADRSVRSVSPPSLEDLASMQVTSVSRKEQRLRDTAAAVFVITQEDIRRSGARNIPEALRMVPGLHVARISSHQWAISARGFNGRFANKMLVLIDGRSVYSSVFSGVFWETQDTILEDIERIEVIRGPGATMWGANAVNGVISIITKNSRDTQGSLVSAGVGSEGQRSVQARHGGALGRLGHYRVFGKANRYESLHGENDSWTSRRGGMRADLFLGGSDTLRIQNDFYETNANDTLIRPDLRPPYWRSSRQAALASGISGLARWERDRGNGQAMSLEAYVDYAQRDEGLGAGYTNQINIDAQRRFTRGLHEFTVGAGYRAIDERISRAGAMSFTPPTNRHNLFSTFVQDQIGSAEDPVNVTIGTKVEHNAFTGSEIQPRLQATVRLSDRSNGWLAFGRAVRTPSLYERSATSDLRTVPGQALPAVLRLVGSMVMKAETLVASEGGYRYQPTKNLAFDLAVFYNQYGNLRTLEPVLPVLQQNGGHQYLLAEVVLSNNMSGQSSGVEATAQYNVTSKWRVSGNLSWLRLDMALNPGSRDTLSKIIEDRAPERKVEVRSYYDLGKSLELDTMLYHVSKIAGYQLPSYTRADVRLGWHWRSRVELSLQAENILDSRHIEFEPESFGYGRVLGRTLGSKLTWRF
jgi:iron complex outermembrane recepter protein